MNLVRSRNLCCALLLLAGLAGCAREDAGSAAESPVQTAPGVEGPGTAGPAGQAPRFEDYPAGRVEGIERPAPVDLSSHPDARQFRTVLSRGAAAGPNFAGHYTVVTWGCGTMCQRLMIVDARDGRVFEGPIVLLGVEHRLDSRLLVLNPPEAVRENPCPVCRTEYYLWTGEGLQRIGPSAEAVRQRAWVDSLHVEEAQRLRPHAAAVARPARERLVITAREGRQRVFADEISGDEVSRLHLFRGYFAGIDQHLVEVIYVPEGGQHLLVDARTGRVTEVDAPPVPSPDGRRFITASLDLVAGHSPNRLRIYRMEGGTPVLEWELEPGEWGGTNPRWEDRRTIRLERAEVDWSTTPLGLRTSPLQLELEGQEWRIRPSPGG